jgi:hypothetical protein
MRPPTLVRIATPVALALLTLAWSAPVLAGQGDVNFILGGKSLDSKDWGEFDSQVASGAEVSFGRDAWPIRIAIDEFDSVNQDHLFGGFTADVSISELDIGVRKIWGDRATRPFVGGGLALGYAKIDFNGISDRDDFGAGAWVGGGVFWRTGSRFNIGFTVRYSKVDVDLGGGSVDAGGVGYGLLLGFGWPKKV